MPVAYVNTYEPKVNKCIDSSDCSCENPVCTHNTTDEVRAVYLLQYTESLPIEPLLFPLQEDERGPIIRGRCRLDSERAKQYLLTPQEAATKIREEGIRGCYIYAGKESHNTQGLLFTDEDEPDEWGDMPETLRVVSGSGTSYHGTYIVSDDWPRKDSGVPKGSSAKDIGGIQAYNEGVVAPGSIHHKTEGIYHTVNARSPATLTVDDVPEELVPTVPKQSMTSSKEEEEGKQTGPVTSPSHRPSRDSTGTAKEYPVDTGTVDFNIGDRLEYGRKKNENFDALCRWAETDGESPVRGYGNDRSRTECALVTHLAFWLERNEKAVRHTMNRLNPPKWAERGTDYRDSVLAAIEVQQDIYTGNESSPSSELTFAVWFELIIESPLSTADIAESIDYGQTQTRKALDYLDDKEVVSYTRNGRSGQWIVENELSVDWEGIDDELNSIEARDEYLGYQ